MDRIVPAVLRFGGKVEETYLIRLGVSDSLYVDYRGFVLLKEDSKGELPEPYYYRPVTDIRSYGESKLTHRRLEQLRGFLDEKGLLEKTELQDGAGETTGSTATPT